MLEARVIFNNKRVFIFYVHNNNFITICDNIEQTLRTQIIMNWKSMFSCQKITNVTCNLVYSMVYAKLCKVGEIDRRIF